MLNDEIKARTDEIRAKAAKLELEPGDAGDSRQPILHAIGDTRALIEKTTENVGGIKEMRRRMRKHFEVTAAFHAVAVQPSKTQAPCSA